MCVITEKLKERFCKDLNLPIKIYQEPFFSERLYLYDKQYDCVQKYFAFTQLVNRCGGEQQYFELYNKIKDDAINYLNQNEYMHFFAKEEDFSKFKIQNIGFPKSDIYHQSNHGKCFISFDMRKGNFTALRHYDKRIVANCDKYEDFLGLFTKESHLLYSKYIRQVIFGNVNPKRQVTYEQYLMDIVLTKVLEYFPKESIVFFSTDEIIVEIDKEKSEHCYNLSKNIVDFALKENIDIRAEIFILHKIDGIDGYIKKFLFGNSGIEIKSVNHIMMPFVLRKINNEEIKENDSVFLYENMLVKLLQVPEINISY